MNHTSAAVSPSSSSSSSSSSSASSSSSSSSSSSPSSSPRTATTTTLLSNSLLPEAKKAEKTVATKRISESTTKAVPKKKVALTRIDPMPSSGHQSKPTEKEDRETVCFEVDLIDDVQTDSKDEPIYIFNWLDLMASRVNRPKSTNGSIKKDKNNSVGSVLDPYASDDEDQLKALARKFEERYGGGEENKSASAIRRKKNARKVDDYADLGYGYDSDDPFIDNSEVHDEIVPINVEPAYGGFYVNTGPLEFKAKKVDEDEDSVMEAVLKADNKDSNQTQTIVKRRKKNTSTENSNCNGANKTQKTVNKPKTTGNSTTGDKTKKGVKNIAKRPASKTTTTKASNESTKKINEDNVEKSKPVATESASGSNEKTLKRSNSRKEGSKQLGRPKKRNPDGSLVHPPKLAKVKKPVLLSSKETTPVTSSTSTSTVTITSSTSTTTNSTGAMTPTTTSTAESKTAATTKKRGTGTNKTTLSTPIPLTTTSTASSSTSTLASSSTSRVASVLEQNSSLSISKVPVTLNVSLPNAKSNGGPNKTSSKSADSTKATINSNKPIDNDDVRNLHDVVQQMMMGVPSPSSSSSKAGSTTATKLAGGATILAVNTANVGTISKDVGVASTNEATTNLNKSVSIPKTTTTTSTVTGVSKSSSKSSSLISQESKMDTNRDQLFKSMFSSSETTTSPPPKSRTPTTKKISTQASPVSPSPARPRPTSTTPTTTATITTTPSSTTSTHGSMDYDMLQQMQLFQQASMLYLQQNSETFNQLVKQTGSQQQSASALPLPPALPTVENARKPSDVSRSSSHIDGSHQKGNKGSRPQDLSSKSLLQGPHSSSSQISRSMPLKDDVRSKDEEIRRRHRESILLSQQQQQQQPQQQQQSVNSPSNAKSSSASSSVFHNSSALSVTPTSLRSPVVYCQAQSRASTWQNPQDSSLDMSKTNSNLASRGVSLHPQEAVTVSLSSNSLASKSPSSARQLPSSSSNVSMVPTQPYLSSQGVSISTSGHHYQNAVDPVMLSPPTSHLARQQQPLAKLPTVPTPSVLTFAATSGAVASLTSNPLFSRSHQQPQQPMIPSTQGLKHHGLYKQQPK